MGNFSQLVYLVPLFPLVGFLINGLLWNKMPKSLAGVIGSLAILASFCVSLGIFFEVKGPSFHEPVIVKLFDFIQSGSLYIPLAFQVDQLSSLFLLIITGVGFLIHVYSTSYMHHDEGMVKYFAYLNLFVFSMLLLILGANYLVMFIGWEGVGLCSYLLIGFWFKKREYTNAAKKAFVMNRIGDLGFLVGMLLVLYNFGTLSYKEFFGMVGSNPSVSPNLYTWITICFFIGATGKSAQIPLYTWLPDAMAGPTPVSALIHAATMVTAGIYMIARSGVLYALAPVTLHIVAIIGLATAILAATIAIRQYDIKKVLAYSTVSQLGFMFLSLGVGAYTTAVFHVMTHAFFKALMFLGSGSVIHAMDGEQDVRKMGGLHKYMKVTSVTFFIGCLAISGVPGLSGFFSKDAILTAAFGNNPVLYALGVAAAMMTAFYMFRLYFLTFSGSFRGTHEQEHHLHESPAAMTIPLVILAILSVVGGYVGMPEVFIHHENSFNEYLGAVVKNVGQHELAANTEFMLMGISTGASVIMIFVAMSMFRKPTFNESTGLAKVLENKWYVDELYDAIIVRPIEGLSKLLDRFVEKMGIDGIVNGVGKTVKWGGDRLRLLQSGQVGFYIFIMVLGMVALFALSFIWIH